MKERNKELTDMQRAEAAWKRLEPLLDENADSPGIVRSLRYKRGLLAAAAVFLLFLSFVLTLFYWSPANEEIYQTAYGQTKMFILPDSSVVTLKGNSRLSYQEGWLSSSDRISSLSGEAWFSVKHTVNNQKFIIRTDNGPFVEVLGTEFNMFSRKKETRVMLSSGKVRLTLEEKGYSLIMHPGDLVDYNTATNKIVKKAVDPARYSIWQKKGLYFDDNTLEEVVKMITQTYGYDVEVSDPVLLKKRVSGSAPAGNIKLMIRGLSEAFGLRITAKGKKITISSVSK